MDENQYKDKEQNLKLKDESEEIKDKNSARDAQRNMAWFALFGMLLYPFAVLISSFLKLDKAAEILGSMAPTYFVSVAAIVAAFYGKEVLQKKK